jgi:hemerythrin-like domain-containing protein
MNAGASGILLWRPVVSRTNTLRQQHDIIIVKAQTIRDMAERASPGAVSAEEAESILRELRRLDTILTAHLISEDTFLYSQMIASGDVEASVLARRFAIEMGGLSKTYRAFYDTWAHAQALASDLPGFRLAFSAILAPLSHRIMRENEELYPLADRVCVPFRQQVAGVG